MEEVERLERDVGGLKAIVLNKRRRLNRRYGGLLKLDEQLEALCAAAANGSPFVSPNGPDEDELLSTCIY